MLIFTGYGSVRVGLIVTLIVFGGREKREGWRGGVSEECEDNSSAHNPPDEVWY
jgi:hypothetical protein